MLRILFLALALLISQGAFAACSNNSIPPFVCVQSAQSEGSGTSRAFGSLTITNGHLIVVGVDVNAQAQTLSCSDSVGNTWANATSLSNATGDFTNIIAYAVMTAATGAVVVTCSKTGGSAYFREAIAVYSGAALTSPLDVAGGANGSGTAPNSGNVTTTVANTLIVGWAKAGGGSLVAGTGSGFTGREIASFFGIEDKIGATAGSYSSAFTSATGQWTALVAAFKPLQAAADTPAAMINSPQVY